MPYHREHKQRTRARIVDAARRLFNRHGFEQVSIDAIMAGAGLTRGGFYHHFASKDELYAEAVMSFSTCNPFKPDVVRTPMNPQELARALVHAYLGDEVFGQVDYHCPLYALPGDVFRAGMAPQRAYTTLIRNLTGVYARALEGCPDAAERAQAIVSTCVGGMLLARTTDDPSLRTSLRRAALKQALALLEPQVR
ncbi:MAG: TetR/AcrR family transcriptional regulator [Telluria sp.]